jgi:rare lipoprotein A
MSVVLRALVIVLVMLVAACGAAQTKKRSGTGTGTGTGEVQSGMATWYATGTMTASGERFDKNAMTAAHRTLPFGTVVRVTHRRSRKSVTVRINDRGPFGSKKRIIDVSKAAGAKLGIIDEGVAPVTVEIIKRAPPRKKKKR